MKTNSFFEYMPLKYNWLLTIWLSDIGVYLNTKSDPQVVVYLKICYRVIYNIIVFLQFKTKL